MPTQQKKPKRTMTAQQKANAKASAKRHGRSKPGLWENVNASKGNGPTAGRKCRTKAKGKGKTRPGKRSRKAGRSSRKK
ncbi:MAG: hypothetical protein NVSMB55_06500 [Mycobacteriales bacterium]